MVKPCRLLDIGDKNWGVGKLPWVLHFTGAFNPPSKIRAMIQRFGAETHPEGHHPKGVQDAKSNLLSGPWSGWHMPSPCLQQRCGGVQQVEKVVEASESKQCEDQVLPGQIWILWKIVSGSGDGFLLHGKGNRH